MNIYELEMWIFRQEQVIGETNLGMTLLISHFQHVLVQA